MLEIKSILDALITKMEKTSNVPRKVSIFSRSRIGDFYKGGVASRWSFGPNSAWSSIETMTIGKMHLTLHG